MGVLQEDETGTSAPADVPRPRTYPGAFPGGGGVVRSPLSGRVLATGTPPVRRVMTTAPIAPVAGGWPDPSGSTRRYGCRMSLVPGFLVFVQPEVGQPPARVEDGGSFRNPTAVGWPRVDNLDPTVAGAVAVPPTETPVRAGRAGAAIRSDAGRDDTVQEYGMSLPQGSYGVVSRETSTPAQRGAADPGSGMRPAVSNTYTSSAAGSHPAPSGPASPDATGFRATASVPPPGSSVPPAEFSSAPHGATGYVPVSAPPANRPPSPRPQPTSTHVEGEDQSATAYGASDANTTASGSSEDPPLAMEAMRAVQILNPSGEVTMPRPTRQRVMCVANQKGGVGKTTTTVNLAVALALHGNRVLVVDLDPQGNASTGLNVPHHAGVPDVYDCLIDQVPMEEVAQAVEGIPNLYCVPATIDLAGAEIELVSVVARESRLGRAIQAFPMEFDYVFIDCPPSLGLLTVNALCAAQEVLIPIQCEYYALEGLNQLLNNINLVKAHLNPSLDVSTILLTMYDRRTRLADAVEQDVRNHFGEKVLTSVIPRNVRVSEAPSYGQSVMTYDPGSRGATSYFEAAQEIAERGAKIGVGA